MAELQQLIPDFGEAYAFEKLTVTNTAAGKALTQTVYETNLTALDDSIGNNQTGPVGLVGNVVTKVRPRMALISVESQPMRYLFTKLGTVAQGAGGGMALLAGQSLIIKGHGKVKDFRIIADNGSNSGTIQVTYFR
jgi:hypothetical protein